MLLMMLNKILSESESIGGFDIQEPYRRPIVNQFLYHLLTPGKCKLSCRYSLANTWRNNNVIITLRWHRKVVGFFRYFTLLFSNSV